MKRLKNASRRLHPAGMTPRVPVCLSLLLLAACASAPPVREAPPVATPPATPRAAPPKPARFACRYKTGSFYPPKWKLAPAGSFAPFAAFTGSRTPAELTVPYGDARHGLEVVLTDAKVRLQGRAFGDKPFRVYARTPLAPGQVYRTEPGAPLAWVSAKPGELLFDVDTPDTWRPRELLRVAVRCEDTQLSPIYKPMKKKDVPLPDGGVQEIYGEDEEALTLVSPAPGPDGGVQDFRFAWDTEIPVAAKVGAEPEGALFFKQRKDSVLAEPGYVAKVLELTPTHARVHYTAWPAAIIEGWVPRTALRVTPRQNLSNIFGMLGGLGSRGGGQGAPDRLNRCTREVPLFVRKSPAFVQVGALQKGAAVEQATRWDDAVDVTLPELHAVKLEGGWHFALRPDDASACLPGVTPGFVPRRPDQPAPAEL